MSWLLYGTHTKIFLLLIQNSNLNGCPVSYLATLFCSQSSWPWLSDAGWIVHFPGANSCCARFLIFYFSWFLDFLLFSLWQNRLPRFGQFCVALSMAQSRTCLIRPSNNDMSTPSFVWNLFLLKITRMASVMYSRTLIQFRRFKRNECRACLFSWMESE